MGSTLYFGLYRQRELARVCLGGLRSKWTNKVCTIATTPTDGPLYKQETWEFINTKMGI